MNHLGRKLQNASYIIAAMLCLCASAASAQTLIKPVDGATVRETVRIAVADVAPGGYISVYVDKRFVGATAGDANTSGKAAPVVFPWDSKAPFDDITNGGTAGMIAKDGTHDLTVDIHGSNGDVTSTLRSTFILANKLPRTSVNDKTKLTYKFRTGGIAVYRVNVDSKMGGSSGDEGGTSPIGATYKMIQTVEDARSDGTALLSYQVAAGASCRVLGQIKMLNDGKASSSVYKEIDPFGQVIRRDGILQDNVLAKKGRRSLPTVLLQLPRKPVKVGETWSGVEKQEFGIQGIGDVVYLSSKCTLEDLEWENGQKCAKIKGAFSGAGRLVANDKNPATTRVDGDGIFYFALNTGKLIKSRVTLTSYVNVDVSMVDSSSSSNSSAPPTPNYSTPDYGDDGYGGASRPSAPSQPSGPASGGIVTSGTLRATISSELL